MSAITTRTIWRRYFEQVETEEPDADDVNVRREAVLPTNSIDNDNSNDNTDNNTNTHSDEQGNTMSIDTTSISLATDDDNDIRQRQQQHDDSNTYNFETLHELEEERDRMMRESRSLALCSGYFLCLLWLQTFATQNIGILLASFVASFCFCSHLDETQARIDTLDQMIADWEDNGNTTTHTTRRGGRRPSGVAEIVKDSWDNFLFNSRASLIRKENFGSQKNDTCLFTIDDDEDDDEDNTNVGNTKSSCKQEQHYIVNVVDVDSDDTDEQLQPLECCICLGEYEKGDELVCLHPCRHVFHKECIAAWTDHNRRCPLCNVDLSVDANHEITKVTAHEDGEDEEEPVLGNDNLV